MKILVRSSSFIMPNNDAWQIIDKKSKFTFADYFDFHSNKFYKDSVDCEILIFFLNDVIDYYLKENFSITKEKKRYC